MILAIFLNLTILDSLGRSLSYNMVTAAKPMYMSLWERSKRLGANFNS